jgi:hypothetical protein
MLQRGFLGPLSIKPKKAAFRSRNAAFLGFILRGPNFIKKTALNHDKVHFHKPHYPFIFRHNCADLPVDVLKYVPKWAYLGRHDGQQIGVDG